MQMLSSLPIANALGCIPFTRMAALNKGAVIYISMECAAEGLVHMSRGTASGFGEASPCDRCWMAPGGQATLASSDGPQSIIMSTAAHNDNV